MFVEQTFRIVDHLNVSIMRLTGTSYEIPEEWLPKYATAGAAGMDLYSPFDVWIEPEQVLDIPLGFCIAIPPGFEGQIRSRSGLGLKGIFVVNSPGTIDSDYRGEVHVFLAQLGNLGQGVYFKSRIRCGDRIAQLVIAPVCHTEWVVVDELPPTGRGMSGMGSTGR